MGIVTLETNSQARLDVVNGFFREMARAEIAYCHWKSNEHLTEGLLGITDLDVLVERGKTRELNHTLFTSGFKLFNAMSTHGYPAVEDYLAVDPSTGTMVHLHLHYQLICGEPHLKGYRLPWEYHILKHRQYDDKEKVFIVEPHMEMLLLIVRAVLKCRTRDKILNVLGKAYFRGERLREFLWLQSQVTIPHLTTLTASLLGKNAAAEIENIVASPAPTLHQILSFRHSIRSSLKLFRTYHPLHARWLRTLREFYWICGGINKRYIHAPVPLRRISANGGLLIAFIGCDGSGKSTHIRSIQQWLAWKMDAMSIYFGSGSGSSSLLRWPLKIAAKLIRQREHRQKSTHDGPQNQQHSPVAEQARSVPLKRIAKVLWALTLSLEKRHKLRQATKARHRGIVVLCDRYPQNQLMGFNDGPLLADWISHPSRVLRLLAQWESQPYRSAEIYPPDLVIKLTISADIAMQRKSDMSYKQFEQRTEAVSTLSFPDYVRVVHIDAAQPIEQVLLEIKREIWREF